MKFVITFAIFAVVFSVLKATELSDLEIRMFLPFMRRFVPPPCPKNEMYFSCTGKCSDCIQRDRCVVASCQEGCDCITRFFRLTKDGPCEPVANCPIPECGENEVFRACGPVCETCTNLECRIINCDHKCYCKEGYLRNKEGLCIPKEDCPKRSQCTDSEEWAESGPVDEFCIHELGEDLTNKTQDIPGCYCKEGFERNLLGYCVNATVCPLINCHRFEEYQKCIPKCNTTCRNYGNPDCSEDENCYAGCFCPPGYVMNDFRSCIKTDECASAMQQVNTPKVDENTGTTLPPTCVDTDETTIAIDSTMTDGTAEFVTEKDVTEVTVSEKTAEQVFTAEISTSATSVRDTNVKETTSVKTVEQISTLASPTSATSVTDRLVKEKSYKKDKITKDKITKQANIAKEKETTKYVPPEDEDEFENEDI